jgi:hypothetical protein
MRRTFALLFALWLASACTTSGYERASATADKTTTYQREIVRLGEQVGLTTEALRALEANPGDSPRSNQETFETYARELANLEDAAARARKTHGRMDGRAERFFGGWNEDTARIGDADLKKSAADRRSALQASYAALDSGQQALDSSLREFVRELEDLRLYLEHDLTAAGIASARASIARAAKKGAELEQLLTEQAHAAESARTALAPLKELAPSRSGGSRVR